MAKGWYIVNTLSGHENKVKATLEKRITKKNLEDFIFQVKVPIIEVTEVKDGKRRTRKKKFLPGYIMVEMEDSDDAWYEVLNVPGVAKFVGTEAMPKPLTPQEVENLFQQLGEAAAGSEKVVTENFYEIGEQIKVIDGPFSNFIGVVEEINSDKGRMRIRVEIFGRSTPVELNFNQVGKL